jgi:DNA (cytosine-5)-methyltransferase 1
MLTLGSLFSGSGAFELAASLCGVQSLWASEVEPFAIRVTTKRLPAVQHLGDIRHINGAAIPPVDIISGGSPCQNLSLAGRRDGLRGDRSILFFEMIRIIREMREATGGYYPRYAVWENVPGALISTDGEDFRYVLECFARCKEGAAHIPRPARWPDAGLIMGEGLSIAWRVLDTQFHRVPQRRRRVYLIADFAADRAGAVLFEPEGGSRNIAAGIHPWQSAPSAVANSTEEASGAGYLTPWDWQNMRVSSVDGVAPTLSGCDGGGGERNPAGYVATPTTAHTLTARHDGSYTPGKESGMNVVATFLPEPSAKARGIAYSEVATPTLKNKKPPCALMPDTPLAPQAFVISSYHSEGMLSANPHAGYYLADTARTLDTRGGSPTPQQGGLAVVSTVPPDAASAPSYCVTECSFVEVEKERTPALLARDYKSPPAVSAVDCRNLRETGDLSATLQAKATGGHSLNYQNPVRTGYAVRRLVPQECALLQGFPADWCDGLETPEPTEEEITRWMDIFETHRLAVGKQTKPKTRAQVAKWLKNPYSDSAAYKLWGNGASLPVVLYVLRGIVEQEEQPC